MTHGDTATDAWPVSTPPKDTAPSRERLEQLEQAATEAKLASDRASQELYDASALLKQTAAPLASAKQNHAEQTQTVEALLIKLQVAEDGLTRADGNYTPVAVSNENAVRAKHTAGTNMSELTKLAKEAGEEVELAKARLEQCRLSLSEADVRKGNAVTLAAQTAGDMDTADKSLVDADSTFQRLHLSTIKLGDQVAAAKLVKDFAAMEHLKGELRTAKTELDSSRNQLDVAAANQMRALQKAEEAIDQAEVVQSEHAFVLEQYTEAEGYLKEITQTRDSLREQFRNAMSDASSIRTKATETQSNFTSALERLYAARAQVSVNKSAVERAVAVLGDYQRNLEVMSDKQDTASIHKQMAERVAERSAEIYQNAKREAGTYGQLVVASEAALDSIAAAEAAAAEAQKARAHADLNKRDIGRVEHAWTLAAKVAEAEAAAVEGFSLEESTAKERANEAARLQRELDMSELIAAKERVTEEDRLRVLEMMEMAKRNRAMDMASKTNTLAGKYSVSSSGKSSGDKWPAAPRTQKNNAVPVKRPFKFVDTECDAVGVTAASASAEEEEEDTGMSISEWFS